MKLLTKALLRQLPPLYATEDQKDPMVIVKFFMPDADWTIYITEFDGRDTFFGYIGGQFPELCYFSLSEIESI